MLRFRATLVGLILLYCAAARAQSWIFESGEYTRDPDDGTRVGQYEELPKIERIPYREYFSEDGPDPFGIDYWSDSYWYNGGWFDFGGTVWDGWPHTPYAYPMFVP